MTDLLQDSSENGDPTLCTSYLFVRPCVVTDVSVLFPMSHLTVTADEIAYL